MSDELMDPDLVEVKMCGRVWPMVPQRQARITAGVGAVIAQAADAGKTLTPASFLTFARGRLYDVLVALIPGMEEIPEFRFHGYVSNDDYAADLAAGSSSRYVAAADTTSATIPEILDAFSAAIKVNRLNDIIGAILDPKVLAAVKAEINAAILDSLNTSLSSLQPVSGGSTQTSSSTPAATNGVAMVSPGLASSG